MFVIYEYSDAKLIILSFAIIKPAAFFAEIKYAAPQNVWTISKFLQDEATRDIGKTTSYAGKIMSDIIQITSDLFFAVANLWETKTYTTLPANNQFSANQAIEQKLLYLEPKRNNATAF